MENEANNTSEITNPDSTPIEAATLEVKEAHEPEYNAHRGESIRYISIPDRGFTNGVLDLPAEHFKVWIEADDRKDFAASKVREAEQQLTLNQEELEKAKDRQHGYFTELYSEQDIVSRQANEATYLENRLQAVKEKVRKVEQKLEELICHYSWIPALLFLLAGAVFIGADIGITHDIVVNALNQPDGFEAWLFACALAFVAFLLKPAFDRYIERPYLSGGSKRTNLVTFIIVSILAIGTLTVMGFFRGQTDAERNKLGVLRGELELVEDQLNNPGPGTDLSRLNSDATSLRTNISTAEDKIINHPLRLWVFILSSVLFAIAGSICLSIGFSGTEALIKRLLLLRQLNRETKTAESAEMQLKEAQTAIALAQNSIERLRKQLELHFTPQELLAEIQKWKATLSEAQLSVLEQSIVKNHAIFDDAYARGQKYHLDGTLSVKLAEVENRSQYGPTAGNGASNGKARSRRRRPFIMLRRAIADKYAKSGNHSSTMDAEMEVADV